MQSAISKISGQTYVKAFKPLLFKQKPDNVHQNLLKTGTRLQRVPAVRSLLHSTWAYENEKQLGQEVFGIKFRNPVGLSAGFDKNIELPQLLKSIGFGFMEGGSVTYQVCTGNPRPWFYRLPKSQSLVVNAGLANEGIVKIVERIEQYPIGTFKGFPLNISVAKTNSKDVVSDQAGVADYIGSLKYLKQHPVAKLITINISCPNVYGGEPFTTPERLEKLLKEIDTLKLTQPVLIKMPSSISWPDFDKLLEVATKHHIAGITISNLSKDRSQANLKDPLPDSVKGNLSGKVTWDLSNNHIRQAYKKYGERFIIIGVGGIFSAKDAYTKIKLGATLVELITGMIYEGPQLIGQINRGLAKLSKKDGFDNISQAIGIDA